MDLRKSNLYHPIPKNDHIGSRIGKWMSKSKKTEPVLVWKPRTKKGMRKGQKIAGYFIIALIIIILATVVPSLITFLSS